MVNKYYAFSDLTFAVKSEVKIAESPFFGSFHADEKSSPDYNITVRFGAVPARTGKEIYTRNTSALYKTDSKELFFSSYIDAGTAKITDYAVMDKNGSELMLTVNAALRENVLFRAINVPAQMLENGAALLHSSFVIANGEAILFTGKSGIGKTTQAMLWQRFRNAVFVNGDRVALKFRNGSLFALPVPFCGSSDVALNREAKVRVIVSLGQSERNELLRLTPTDAFQSILSGITYEPRNPEETGAAVDFAISVAKTGLVYKMDCRDDETSVQTLESIIKR